MHTGPINVKLGDIGRPGVRGQPGLHSETLSQTKNNNSNKLHTHEQINIQSFTCHMINLASKLFPGVGQQDKGPLPIPNIPLLSHIRL